MPAMTMRARALVVHPDPAVRDGWARAIEASGMTVTRCVGPTVSCALDRGCERCPLMEGVALAVDAESILTEEFVAKLRCARPVIVIAARDRCRTDGTHEPVFSRVVATAV